MSIKFNSFVFTVLLGILCSSPVRALNVSAYGDLKGVSYANGQNERGL